MRTVRTYSVLLLALYLVAYLAFLVPMHLAEESCEHQCDKQEYAIGSNDSESSKESTRADNDHRCEVCLSGGLAPSLPASFALTINYSAVSDIAPGAMASAGVTLSHCRLSRAPPSLA